MRGLFEQGWRGEDRLNQNFTPTPLSFPWGGGEPYLSSTVSLGDQDYEYRLPIPLMSFCNWSSPSMAMSLPAWSSAASWSIWPGGHLPAEILFDAVCETRNCLPDAIQLLTPCTIGNGWLKVVNVGRFALSLYDKYEGEGVRVFLDPVKVADWPEINNWYLKLKPKKEQDSGPASGRNPAGRAGNPGMAASPDPAPVSRQAPPGPDSHLPPVPGSLSGPGWRHLPGLPG